MPIFSTTYVSDKSIFKLGVEILEFSLLYSKISTQILEISLL